MEDIVEVKAKAIEGEVVDKSQASLGAVAAYSALLTDAKLAEYREKFKCLSAKTKEGYEDVRKAIAVCRTTRTGIDKKRKDLNESAQLYIKTVNGEAKRLITAIEEIEEPLKKEKQAVDDERERLKAEAEAAKAKKIHDRISLFVEQAGVPCTPRQAEVWTDADFEGALAIAREAYQTRLKAEQEAEMERKRLEAEQQEEIRKQREEVERQRAELEAIRKEQEAARLKHEEELQRLKAEQDAKQRAEIDRIRAEQEAARLKHEAELQRVRDEQAEKDRVERERLEFERSVLQAENARLAKAEADRVEAVRKEQEAARKADEERIAAEIAEQKRIAEVKRLEELKPDLEKVDMFCQALLAAINSVPVPSVQSAEIRAHFEFQLQQLARIARAKPSVQ